MTSVRAAIAAASALVVCAVSAEAASVKTFRLSDNPYLSSGASYGMRMDGGVLGKSAAFSFNTPGGMYLRVVDNGASISMEIWGDMVHTASGDLFEVRFSYISNVAETATGWTVLNEAADNTGIFRAKSGERAGQEWILTEVSGSRSPFSLSSEWPRMPVGAEGLVGMGEFDALQPQTYDTVGRQDWLFVAAAMVPLPTGAGLACTGLLGLAVARRRRV